MWFWVGFGIVYILWYVMWGHVAIADGWWVYTGENTAFGLGGFRPIFDSIYLFAGLGWYFYFLRWLGIV